MELQGQINEIIYQNEVNGYTIAEFIYGKEATTIVGYLPFINNGDSLKVFGTFVIHPEYGRQFKIKTFEKIMPESLDALEKYLSGGIIKGVGPATAKRIVDIFGEETISILKFEPEKLSKVKGINEEKAIKIAEEFNEKWELWQIVGFLEKFGIGASNSKNVYKQLGVNAIKQIEENPYILLDITYGVDFKKIDKMAMDLGVDNNNEKRICSAIKYGLILASYNGHTCVILENLIEFIKNLINVSTEDVEENIINLNSKQEIKIEEFEDNKWVFLKPFYVCEKNIAEKLIALDTANNIKKVRNFNSELEKIEQNSEIKLSDKQKEAIKAVNENNVCVITGGPGTGKTTIIKSIIKLYEKEKRKIVLCAPTGRAAKRMCEATGKDATTIHRLLEIRKVEESGNMLDVNYPISPIDADIIIIDEMSMVDTFLMNYILKGIYLGTKLILVGDSNQLPSVGPGNILKDIIESETITIIELNKIFRQAAKSQIITNAHRVNNGEEIKIVNDKNMLKDFFFINENSQDKMLEKLILVCKNDIKDYENYDFYKNVQILTPTKKGLLGTKELNKKIQEILNPKSKKEKIHGDRVFRIGDRVMQIKNNYDIYWEKKNAENGSGIFNGEFGYIQNIDEELKQIEILFDGEKSAWYEYGELDQIEHSYSITIHKSQRK